MSQIPNHALATVDVRKITDYLLSGTHPAGRAKAAFFKRFGFNADKPEILQAALLEHASCDVIADYASVHGTKYEIVGPMLAPDGRLPRVKSIWIIDTASAMPRFVTAYPA